MKPPTSNETNLIVQCLLYSWVGTKEWRASEEQRDSAICCENTLSVVISKTLLNITSNVRQRLARTFDGPFAETFRLALAGSYMRWRCTTQRVRVCCLSHGKCSVEWASERDGMGSELRTARLVFGKVKYNAMGLGNQTTTLSEPMSLVFDVNSMIIQVRCLVPYWNLVPQMMKLYSNSWFLVSMVSVKQLSVYSRSMNFCYDVSTFAIKKKQINQTIKIVAINNNFIAFDFSFLFTGIQFQCKTFR